MPMVRRLALDQSLRQAQKIGDDVIAEEQRRHAARFTCSVTADLARRSIGGYRIAAPLQANPCSRIDPQLSTSLWHPGKSLPEPTNPSCLWMSQRQCNPGGILSDPIR